MNYYNEFDPKAAAWLRELIKAGEIPPGDVDERSITEIQPHELAKYTQCHFFAGIGGWSLALKLAGVPSTRPLGTGSCPCQPFSAAGAGLGFDDPRHLWPCFFRLIVACRAFGQRWAFQIFGEQVASAAALDWLDRVFADLEGAGYTCGAADLCAAGVGAPQIRQRLYWMASAEGQRFDGRNDFENESPGRAWLGLERRGSFSGLAGTDGGHASAERQQRSGQHGQQPEDGGAYRLEHAEGNERLERGTESGRRIAVSGRVVCGVGEPDCIGSTPGLSGSIAGQEGHAGVADDSGNPELPRERERERETVWLVQSISPRLEGHSGHEHDSHQSRWIVAHAPGPASEAGHVSVWSRCQFLECTDGKTRRIEPESFPLAHGVSGRVGLLRGYGNAIVPQVAALFIQASDEALAIP